MIHRKRRFHLQESGETGIYGPQDLPGVLASHVASENHFDVI